MTKKMIKVWAGIFMLLAGIFVGNMGGGTGVYNRGC